MVTVRFFAAARAAAGVDSESIDVATVAELRSDLVKRHGAEMERVLPACTLLIDGVTGHDDLDGLPADSYVDVLPPFAGG